MSGWNLAQLNIAHLQDSVESEQLSDFVANLDRINALAESADGFVWRLIDADDPMEPSHGFDSDVIVNLSVWDSIELLHNYVYRTVHKDIMRRKGEWFHRMPRAHMVLWWHPANERPTAAQAHEKLRYLQDNGPTSKAFTFRQAFEKPTASSVS